MSGCLVQQQAGADRLRRLLSLTVGQQEEVRVIRLAGTGDISRIEALMKSVPGFWDESWRPDVLQRALASSETIAMVHHEDDTIDGFVCGHDVGFRAYLSELVVSPAAQGRGVGSQLVSELELHLADRGCSVLIADVWRNAERFYRSRGWTPPDVVLLRKRLDAPAAQPAVADGRDPRLRSGSRR